MTEFTHSDSPNVTGNAGETAINRRIFRTMAITVLLAFVASLFVGNWRTSAGIALGGSLSLLNFAWMQASVAAAFAVAYAGQKPQLRITQYFLRYLMIAVVVLLVYKLRFASVTAMIFALCSFVPAILVEATREFYFAITRREEVG